MSDERRAFTRVTLHLQAEVELSDGSNISGTTQDLSATGFLLKTDTEINELPISGTAVLSVDGEAGTLEPMTVDIQIVVQRPTSLYGCEITAVHRPEAFADLKRFVLYNAEDPNVAEQEFDQHNGIRPRRDA